MDLSGGYFQSEHYARAQYSVGEADGFRFGRKQGYDEGHDEGYNTGYSQGRQNGHKEGYRVGWREAVALGNKNMSIANGEIACFGQLVARLKGEATVAAQNYAALAQKNTQLEAMLAKVQTEHVAVQQALKKLQAEHVATQQAQKQGEAMQGALRKANEQLQQQLEQVSQERDAKHQLSVNRAYKNNRLSIVLGAARDTLREITEEASEPARRIAKLFAVNYARTEAESLARRLIKAPLIGDPEFSNEAPRTVAFVEDMLYIVKTDPPNRLPLPNESFFAD